MKIFSLKALGAFICAAGLVVAGVAAPAFASISDTQTYYGGGTGVYAGQAQAGALTIRISDTAQAAGQHYFIKLDGADMANSGSVCHSQNTDQFFSGSGAASDLWTGWANTLCNVVSATSPSIIEFQGESASATTSGFIKINTKSLVAAASATQVVLYASSDGSSWTRLTDGASTVSVPLKKRLVYDVTSTCVSSAPSSVTSDLTGTSTVTLPTNLLSQTPGQQFAGWSTTQGGSVAYAGGATFTGFTTGMTLYAVCEQQQQQQNQNQNPPQQNQNFPQQNPPQQNQNNCSVGAGNYVFSTRGNGGATAGGAVSCGYLVITTSGSVPANNYLRPGYTFTGWNSQPDGQGNSYAPGDSITVTRNIMNNTGTMQSFYAQWSASSSVSNSSSTRPSARMGLTLNRGARVNQAPAPVTASGLQPNAPYTVEVHSTPVIIASGNVASDGSVNYTAAIPSGLEAGWHTMIFTSTAADGTTFTSSYYFKVAGDGTLLSTSETVPAELAYTGTANPMPLLVGTLSLALIGAEMFLIARRKRSN